ncbi:DELTA-thalatoxin-Avl1a-like isoform X1 [Anguilla rostrata]|uniref:DELTA-thalatoxin-Avl1a-like isoform X1 n=1 Tax=Anguilla rostrata TaxID=7938 RepID=UPI0030D30DBB
MSNDAAAIAGVASAAVSGADLVNSVIQDPVNMCLRSVIINLTNSSSYILINPQVYTYSGYCYTSPKPTVEKKMTEKCSFGQTKGTASGAVGVLTYDITEDRKKKAVERLAIMFSVPFDYNLYENWFALGLFEATQACDHALYNCMYHEKEKSFRRGKATGSEISYQSKKFTLSGNMSPVAKAEIIVELWDKD